MFDGLKPHDQHKEQILYLNVLGFNNMRLFIPTQHILYIWFYLLWPLTCGNSYPATSEGSLRQHPQEVEHLWVLTSKLISAPHIFQGI